MCRGQNLFAVISIGALLASLSLAQAPTQQARKQAIVQPGGSNPVIGSGTPGQITKWVGVTGSATFAVGDSNMVEDKFGKIGVGTRTPTSPLTVQGMIETTLAATNFLMAPYKQLQRRQPC